MARDPDFFVGRALDAFNAGFASKAKQKEALSDINYAYENGPRAAIMRAALDSRVDMGGRFEMRAEAEAVYWGMPDYPHLWKPRHAELVRKAFGADLDAHLAKADELAALREQIKAAPVAPAPVKAENPYEVKVRAKLSEIYAKRKADYLHAVELGEIFGGLPVHVNAHIVHGHKGAVFWRRFYYLDGRLVALNVLIAAAEELERRKEAAEKA